MRFLLLLTITLAVVDAKSYQGYQLYRLHVTNEDQVRLLSEYNHQSIVDFWSPIRYGSKPIDVMVGPKTQSDFSSFLNLTGIQNEIAIDNIERVVRNERIQQLLAPRTPRGSISFTKYHKYSEMQSYMEQLQNDYPNLVQVENIGRSYEGRDLTLIKISSGGSAIKPVIFIDAGIHAREWIAPAQALYIIQQLVENSANSDLLQYVDWHILPLMNPDGYEYSHTDERFWRKTRSTNSGSGCKGTDGNRNFGFHWGEGGASSWECSDTYMGPEAFSEVETRSVRDYILKHKDQIKLYLTFHSYGNYLLYPWGYTSALPSNVDDLDSLAVRVNDAIVSAGGDSYEIGTSTNVLYIAAGGSDDWAMGDANINLSYTVELPGGNEGGFDLPPSKILKHVQQTFAGIAEYGKYIKENFAMY